MLATTIELKVSRTQLDVPSHDSLGPSDRLTCQTSPTQAMKLRVFCHTLVLLSILAIRMSELFRCGEPCNRTFSNSRGLSNHRNTCRIYFHRKTALAVGAQTRQLKRQPSTCALEERPSKRPSSILTMVRPLTFGCRLSQAHSVAHHSQR